MLENPWSPVWNPTSALSPSGSSFGPSSLTPVGIHHLLLSNLTTVLASSWGSLGAGRGMAALSVVCREKQKERQREEMWKKLNQFAEKHKSNMQRKTRWAEVSVGQTVAALFHYAVAADVPFDFIRCDRLYFLYVSDKLLMWWTDGWSSLLQRFSHAAAGRTCVLLVCLFVTPFRHTHLCVSCMVLLTAWYQEPLWWYKYGCHFYIQFFVSAVFPSSDLTDLANSEQSVDSHAAIVVRGLLRHILQLVSSWASYCSHSLVHWHLSKVTCSLLSATINVAHWFTCSGE